MNANDKWKQLAGLARPAPPAALPEIPHGFATRVASRCLAVAGTPPPSMWEWVSLRGLALAALLMLISVGVNYDFLQADWTHDLAIADDVLNTLWEP